MDDIKLRWTNEPKGNKQEVEDAIRKDLSSSFYSKIADKPWNLLTHTVFLGPSMDEGPAVHMWGVEGDDHFNCEWLDDIEWVSLKDWGDDEISEQQGSSS